MGVWYAIDGSYGNWTWTETAGGRWWNEDQSLEGAWDKDPNSDLIGTWSEDTTGITGTWASETDSPNYKYGTSDNFGVWYAPDGSTGNWTYSETQGGRWTREDGGTGSWVTDDTNELAGTWFDDSSDATGSWIATEDEPNVKIATAGQLGTWETPDGGFGFWSDGDGNYIWASADNETQGIWNYDLDTEMSGSWQGEDDEGTWTAVSTDSLHRVAVSIYDRGVWYGADQSEGSWRAVKGEFMGEWQSADGSDSGTWEYDQGSTESGTWVSNSGASGTFYSDANYPFTRFATSGTNTDSGEWFGLDGSIGTWSSSDTDG